MRNIFLKQEIIDKKLFRYPCVDANSRYLQEKTVCLYGSPDISSLAFLKDLGAVLRVNPENKQVSFTNAGVIFPPKITKSEEDCYYEVLGYYIETLQTLIHKQKSVAGFKHIVVILPEKTKYNTIEYSNMAYNSILGIIRGLGMQYAKYGLFINGIVTSIFDDNYFRLLGYLLSDNSCNVVGQIF